MGLQLVRSLESGGTITGDLAVTGNVTIGGDITSVVNLTLTGDVTLTGDGTTKFVVEDVSNDDVFLVDTDTPQVTIAGAAAGTVFATFAGNGTGGSRLTLAGGTWTAGGTDDGPVSITATLNDAGAAGGSDVFTGLKFDLAATDVTGWDAVYLCDLQYATNSIFRASATAVTIGAGVATTQLILPISNDAATPTLAFGDGDTGLYEISDNNLGIATGGALAVTIDSAQNVGVGVTPEAWHANFDVLQLGAAAGLKAAASTAAGGQLDVACNAYNDGSWKRIITASEEASVYTQVNGTHAWFVAGAGVGDSAISWTTAMTIANDGDVTGGATAPTWKLQNETASATNPIYCSTLDDTAGFSVVGNATASVSYLSLITQGAERVRVDAAGNVGIEVTPNAWNAALTSLNIGGLAAISCNTSQAASSAVAISRNAYLGVTSWTRIVEDEAVQYSMTTAGEHKFYVAGSDVAGSTFSWTTAMTIANDGDVTGGTAGSWALQNVAASSTVPTICPDSASTTTGIGGTADWMYLIAGGTGLLALRDTVELGTSRYPVLLPTRTVNITDGAATYGRGAYTFFSQPTFTATNAVTVTDLATVVIDNVPVASTNVTATNSWALLVDAGNCRFDGSLAVNLASFTGTNLAGGIGIGNGTVASASLANAVQLWAADAGGLAGHSGLHMRGEDDAANLVVVGYKEESANAETPQAAATPGTICKFTDSGDASGDGIYILALDGTTWTRID